MQCNASNTRPGQASAPSGQTRSGQGQCTVLSKGFAWAWGGICEKLLCLGELAREGRWCEGREVNGQLLLG